MRRHIQVSFNKKKYIYINYRNKLTPPLRFWSFQNKRRASHTCHPHRSPHSPDPVWAAANISGISFRLECYDMSKPVRCLQFEMVLLLFALQTLQQKHKQMKRMRQFRNNQAFEGYTLYLCSILTGVDAYGQHTGQQ